MREGELVAGRFTIELLAGEGGTGRVYRAHDTERGGLVALKIARKIPESEDESEDNQGRLAREATVLSELHHPRIVGYVAHGVASTGEAYLAMEWLEGEDLSACLAHRGPLSVEESLTVVHGAAEALGAAHTLGVVHCRVMPNNLFLSEGDIKQVKVPDFGSALRLDVTHALTEPRPSFGNPAYMAPEQVRGDGLDARVDVYALGCVLFECLTGQLPFDRASFLAQIVAIMVAERPRVREIRPDVPAVVDALLARMFSKDASARPRDGAALAVEIAALRASSSSAMGR